jgi:LAO/AO transport system kinase
MVAIEKILQGSPLDAARLITLLESGDPAGRQALKALYPHTGRAYRIGVTGPAGAGKSTLVSRLIGGLRGRGLTVGVLAVDPSSPYSGGALLGDRIRMQAHAADPGVFIRSMASRGRPGGGIGRNVREAALVMDAMGCAVILIETVGAGQGEVEIAGCAHATAVVSVPGLGDEIQAMKAGLLEIADIYVVNKADLPGAEELAAMLASLAAGRRSGPKPPVLLTVATANQGVDRLVEELLALRGALEADGRMAARRAADEWGLLREIVMEMAARRLFAESPGLARLREELGRRAVDPYTAAERIVAAVMGRPWD